MSVPRGFKFGSYWCQENCLRSDLLNPRKLTGHSGCSCSVKLAAVSFEWRGPNGCARCASHNFGRSEAQGLSAADVGLIRIRRAVLTEMQGVDAQQPAIAAPTDEDPPTGVEAAGDPEAVAAAAAKALALLQARNAVPRPQVRVQALFLLSRADAHLLPASRSV